MLLYTIATALSLTAAVVSIWATMRYYAHQAAAAAVRAEAAALRAEARASATVKKTQEILASRYSHDRLSPRTVTPSPLVRKINHGYVEEDQPTGRSSY